MPAVRPPTVTRSDDAEPVVARPPPSSESTLFTAVEPTTLLMTTIGGELEARRGWKPPPRSSGIRFAIVSVVVIASAIVGTVYVLGPSIGAAPRTTTGSSPSSVEPTSILGAAANNS